ncbi:MAG: XTP/dITP diphosphatase [Clostridia bacterium]|nr:XTP/dITP diphosphatase [Clostridia bacterium]
MKFILASKNIHKAKEMQSILGESITLITQDEAGYTGIDVVEDGLTFEENAIKKAVTLANASGQACIADDSGLCVDALGGKPGVFTARFAGEGATDDENISKLLADLDSVSPKMRTARFVCVIALAVPGKEPVTYRGECEGVILNQKQGSNGFGYDPIFYLPEYGASMAEVSPEVKNSVSHRFNALKKLKADIA